MRRFAVLGVLLVLSIPPSAGAYDTSAAGASECRVGTPADLAWTEALPDGGRLYHYALDGDTVVPSPPIGFDPLRASDSDLERYGFPPRPARAEERSGWTEDMATWQPSPHRGLCVTDRRFGSFVDGPDALVSAVPPGIDVPWSGYVADESVDTYIAAQGDYNQKAFGATACSPAEMGSWVGIGGYTTGSLIQVGTGMFKQSGVAKYWAWYEYIRPANQNPAVEMPNVDVNPGDNIHLYTVHQRSTGITTFYVHNGTNGTNQSCNQDLGEQLLRWHKR